MLSGKNLLPLAWAAINLETMLTGAWADCFRKHHDLKFDDYKQIIYAVMAQCACYPQGCTRSHIEKSIANAYLIDRKTVATRILRLVDEEFLTISTHPTDRRKRLVEPTPKLIVPFGQFNERVKSIVSHVREQIETNPFSTSIPDLESHLYFDVLKELADAQGDDRDSGESEGSSSFTSEPEKNSGEN